MPADRPPVPHALVGRCARIATSTWSDALDRLGLAGVLNGLERRAGSLPFAGPVVTVAEDVGALGTADPGAFGIDQILASASPGDAILVRQVGDPPASAIGGLAALAARRHGVAGIVVDGACRDLDELDAVGLPILSRSATPASGRGRARITGLNVPLRFPGFEVAPGDLLVADTTGVVILPFGRLTELLQVAEARAASDAAQAAELTGNRPAQT